MRQMGQITGGRTFEPRGIAPQITWARETMFRAPFAFGNVRIFELD